MGLSEELEQQTKRKEDQHREWQKRRYQWAKGLGFTTREALTLQNWGTAKIIQVALERNISKEKIIQVFPDDEIQNTRIKGVCI